VPYRDLWESLAQGQRYNVVVADPTLVYPMIGCTRRQLRGLAKRNPQAIADRLEQYGVNEMMGRWIMQQGYSQSVSFEIWYFDDRLYDGLSEKIEAVCGRYIVRHQLYANEMEALMALGADPGIVAVYDADHDRVDEMWKFRGYRVPLGGTP
jgi:hypothetical protein